ncbi:MAG TPA: exodeoxyribonuclease VII large subunit [Mycobacteriales bacterium]|nr:exodeoxyribonuclease VII large subunit [Mycobacteriales bacterium]
MSSPSTADTPLPVRTLSRHIGEWVGRLGRVWVEGQIAQLVRRPGQTTCFLTLRDTVADVSVEMTVSRHLLDGLAVSVAEGQQVVVLAKPEWWLNRGRLSLTVHEVRPVGAGALLARLEQLKGVLAAEGLFDRDRKRALPFLPRQIGLVTGRESAARRDVEENARRRWPGVVIAVRECVVQGPGAAAAVVASLQELDRVPDVDVIVIARGGGSVEDLLAFSDEALCRAVAACRTPVVSAIGHEQDSPLLDLVADARASTPTHAGTMVVPDVVEESARVLRARRSAWRCLSSLVEREQSRLNATRSRPCLADPATALAARGAEVNEMRRRTAGAMLRHIEDEGRAVQALRAQVRALSPQATLDRGYAVVHSPDGTIVRDGAALSAGDDLLVRLAAGRVAVQVTGVEPS